MSVKHPADNVTDAGSELNTFGLTLAEMIAIGATVLSHSRQSAD